jgi:DNA-binding NarL/FixJ family response regulator
MSNNNIRIAMVDDHVLMRDALSMALQQIDDFQIVGTFSSGEEIVNQFRDVNPHVIIMDIFLKGMSGIEATKWIKERSDTVKVILLSGEIRKDLVTAGIQAGIDGYLPKDIDRKALINAIRTVAGGQKYFNETIATLVFEDYYKREVVSRNSEKQFKNTDLTKREMEVLALIADGMNNRMVADKLFISVKTVDTHKMHILEKLGLKNTAELVKYAIKNKLIILD